MLSGSWLICDDQNVEAVSFSLIYLEVVNLAMVIPDM